MSLFPANKSFNSVGTKNTISQKKTDEIKEKEVKSKYFFESFDPFVNLRKNYERIKGIMKEPEDYSVFAPPKPPPFESPSKNEAKE